MYIHMMIIYLYVIKYTCIYMIDISIRDKYTCMMPESPFQMGLYWLHAAIIHVVEIHSEKIEST